MSESTSVVASPDGPPRVAVVLSGAVARGAFQAGALGHILTRLKADENLEPSIILGTSAGAINAVLWASKSAELGIDAQPSAVAEAVQETWLSMDSARVYEHLVPRRPSEWRRVLERIGLPAVKGFHSGGSRVASLLDTQPLHRTAREILPPELRLTGSLRAVGVTATWVPPAGAPGSASGRSVLFLQERDDSGLRTWPGRADRALDVVRCPIAPEHVLASSAVPAGFPPERVSVGKPGWYVDGGVRLNTPLLPAIELGATHIILISAMSLTYPQYVDKVGTTPSVVDAASQVMHALVADRAVEDLLSLQKMNRLVSQATPGGIDRQSNPGEAPRTYTQIPVIVVAPPPGGLRKLAAEVWQTKYGPTTSLVGLEDNAVLGRVLRAGGDGPGQDELLSYVFFDKDYFRRSYRAGVHAAQNALPDEGSAGTKSAWLTTSIIGGKRP